MNTRLLGSIILSLLIGAVLGYSLSLPQVSVLQSENSSLESEFSTLTTDYNNLNTTYNELILRQDSLNESYVELLQQYEDLLFHYNLVNGPASNFTSIEDLQITLTTYRTAYSYKDPILGNVSITYLNGTTFKGKFGIRIHPEFGGYGAVETGGYDVDGFGDFVVEPPYSFHYGPGIYTIYIGRITTVDEYVVAVGHELDGTGVQVEAK